MEINHEQNREKAIKGAIDVLRRGIFIVSDDAIWYDEVDQIHDSVAGGEKSFHFCLTREIFVKLDGNKFYVRYVPEEEALETVRDFPGYQPHERRKSSCTIFGDLCGEMISNSEIDKYLKQIFESGEFQFTAKNKDRYYYGMERIISGVKINNCQPSMVYGDYIPFHQIATKALTEWYGVDEKVVKEIIDGKRTDENGRIDKIKTMVKSVWQILDSDYIDPKPRPKILEAIMQGPANNGNFLELEKNVTDGSKILKCLKVIHENLGKVNEKEYAEFETIGWSKAKQYLFVIEAILRKKGLEIDEGIIEQDYIQASKQKAEKIRAQLKANSQETISAQAKLAELSKEGEALSAVLEKLIQDEGRS